MLRPNRSLVASMALAFFMSLVTPLAVAAGEVCYPVVCIRAPCPDQCHGSDDPGTTSTGGIVGAVLGGVVGLLGGLSFGPIGLVAGAALGGLVGWWIGDKIDNGDDEDHASGEYWQIRMSDSGIWVNGNTGKPAAVDLTGLRDAFHDAAKLYTEALAGADLELKKATAETYEAAHRAYYEAKGAAGQ